MELNDRRLTAELAEGMSDGCYKKVVTDRGGRVDPMTANTRRDLSDAHFGIAEAKRKVLPDGTTHTTPDYVRFPVGFAADSLF